MGPSRGSNALDFPTSRQSRSSPSEWPGLPPLPPPRQAPVCPSPHSLHPGRVSALAEGTESLEPLRSVTLPAVAVLSPVGGQAAGKWALIFDGTAPAGVRLGVSV